MKSKSAIAGKPVTAKPIRIRLSRKRGFQLQPTSLSLNGLPAVKVDRSTDFGNPVVCTPHGCNVKPCGCCEPYRCCTTVFREYVESGLENRGSYTGSFVIGLDGMAGYPRRNKLVKRLTELRGKNLACWCALNRPCHADILLALANPGET